MDANMTFEEYKNQISEVVTTNSGLCPVCAALSVFNGKWKLSIIYELSVYGSMRFSEIKKVIGNITNTALSNALKDLEKDGILVRKQFNEIPPHVEYSLTEKGEDLLPVLINYPYFLFWKYEFYILDKLKLLIHMAFFLEK